jgi:eukaryotic-like serine/threonine-protein kinase
MIGRTVSHYRILSELGSGGMGVVYRAEDLTLGRHVALKFLPSHLSADPDARRRFVHEAKAAAALDHSGICTVYDSGEVDGQLFIAMALLEGQTLRDRIAAGPLPVAQALELAAQIAEALHEADGKGVTHRDIKPANIMLTPKGQAKVMDFGLAQVAGASQLTRSGSTLGTAAYMSPEQARSEAVDRRTDIWSLGVVLYEMVSGRRPFPGEHEAALLYGIQQGEPEPLTALRTGVPVELERIVGKCLAKDAGRRYQHADELAVDLRQLQAGLGAAPTTASARTIRQPRRAPARAAALLLVLAIAAAGAWLFLRLGRGPSAADAALAVVDFEDLGDGSDSLSAAGLGGLLQVGLIEKCPVRVVSPEYLQDLRRRSFAGAQGPIRSDQALTVARKAGATLLLSGQIGRRNGSTFAVWRLVETAGGRGVGGQRVVQADLVGLADDIIAQVVPLIARRAGTAAPADTGSVGQFTTRLPEAYRHFVTAELAAEDHDFDAAMRHLRAAVRQDSSFALAWMRMGQLRWGLNDPREAKLLYDRAWSLRSRLAVKDRMLLESAMQETDGRLAACLATFSEMLARWPDDRSVLEAYSETLGRWAFVREAEQSAQAGLRLYPDNVPLMSTRCMALVRLGRVTEAMHVAHDLHDRHPDRSEGWNVLGEAFLAAGEADSAEVVWRKCYRQSTDEWREKTDLARCAQQRGEPAGSESLLRGVLVLADLAPPDRWFITLALTGNTHWGLHRLLAETGRLEEALRLLTEAEGAEATRPRSLRLLSERALLLCQWGRPREALLLADRIARRSESEDGRDWAAVIRARALTQLDSLAAARRELARVPAAAARREKWVPAWPLSVKARIELGEGRRDSCVAALEALEAERGLEPGDMETRADALAAMGRFDEAVATLTHELRLNGCRFIARYQLGQIYEEMGRKADAAREYEVFLKAWADADPGWPQVEDARRRLAALRVGR